MTTRRAASASGFVPGRSTGSADAGRSSAIRLARASVLGALLFVFVSSAAAGAGEPTKVGWWNFVPGGASAPAPDVPSGGIRVAVASDQTAAFGAIQVPLDRSATVKLTLTIAHMTGSTSAPSLYTVMACPTKTAAWKAGDNQDGSTAPEYDCQTHHYLGTLDAAATAYTFEVDDSADSADGVLSLAILPAHSSNSPAAPAGPQGTPPFVVDFAKPAQSAFQVTSQPTPPPAGDAVPPPAPANAIPAQGPSGGSLAALPLLSSPNAVWSPTAPSESLPAPAQAPLVAGQPPLGTVIAANHLQEASPASVTRLGHWKVLYLLAATIGFGVLFAGSQTQCPPVRLREAGVPDATLLPAS